jgi:hypothetical protein
MIQKDHIHMPDFFDMARQVLIGVAIGVENYFFVRRDTMNATAPEANNNKDSGSGTFTSPIAASAELETKTKTNDEMNVRMGFLLSSGLG